MLATELRGAVTVVRAVVRNSVVLPGSFAKYSSGTGHSVVDVTTDDEFNKLMKTLADNNQSAVVDFSAEWCGPCKQIGPYFKDMSKEFPGIKFIKVDIDGNNVRKTVEGHNITGVPTFAFYQGGKMLESFSGARIDMLRRCLARLK